MVVKAKRLQHGVDGKQGVLVESCDTLSYSASETRHDNADQSGGLRRLSADNRDMARLVGILLRQNA